MINGKVVEGVDYADDLSELSSICVLCNDSGLDYNEVGLRDYSFFSTLFSF